MLAKVFIFFEHVIFQLFTFNPFHPDFSMHILHTVPYTFPKVLLRGICFIIQSFSDYCEGKLDACHSQELKSYKPSRLAAGYYLGSLLTNFTLYGVLSVGQRQPRSYFILFSFLYYLHLYHLYRFHLITVLMY